MPARRWTLPYIRPEHRKPSSLRNTIAGAITLTDVVDGRYIQDLIGLIVGWPHVTPRLAVVQRNQSIHYRCRARTETDHREIWESFGQFNGRSTLLQIIR